MGKRKNLKMVPPLIIVALVLVVTVICVVNAGIKSGGGGSGLTLDEAVKKAGAVEAPLVKGTLSAGSMQLYDELPDIEKYPLVVEGGRGINIEVVSSPEKAGEGYEDFLIEAAREFNAASAGTYSVSVRSVTSGLGADYIVSGKHVPDMYTPSSSIWGSYIEASGGKAVSLLGNIAGNVAGVIVRKGKGSFKSLNDVIKAVKDGTLSFGYTNPQESTTGLNLLCSMLREPGGKEGFSAFQKNIFSVAYSTMQLRDSARSGKLDALVMEYQTYINEKEFSEGYDFIPFGVRHDNPMYLCKKDKREVCEKFMDFLMGKAGKAMAEKCGFGSLDYSGAQDYASAEISDALTFYKDNKSAGRSISAVFVADRSGSMDGSPLDALKKSLLNGMDYMGSNTSIGLVSYSSDITIDVPLAKVDTTQRQYMVGALQGMQAGGGTDSYTALCVGLDMLRKAKEKNPNTRCVLFLLSDGAVNEGYSLGEITNLVKDSGIPIYTIGYTDQADTEELKKVSAINEAWSGVADSEDVVYRLKSLFKAEL